MASDAKPQPKERPLSPHLQVYRLPLTALMSVSHRASGYAMAVGTIMFIWMMLAAAGGPDAYSVFRSFAGSGLGMLMIFAWSVALFYHMSNGIRHLIWDTGRLFGLKEAGRANYFVMASTVILTLLFWWAACPFKGE